MTPSASTRAVTSPAHTGACARRATSWPPIAAIVKVTTNRALVTTTSPVLYFTILQKSVRKSHMCLLCRDKLFTSNASFVVDIDECTELKIHCGSGKSCFNRRGDFECIDTNCPPRYKKEPGTEYVHVFYEQFIGYS